ncbi:MFS transporter [Mycetocola sp.]|uniref:MFS transporter n=1 Tax=Mycetocola sp. TaxID=1871042 RepID=UPI002639223F|nr:MFS transporter [Mycetocola sp.]MCU1419875.1 transporter [Mycetocola sp.]MCU1559168.1 transporter [Mycetocola sp.]
MTAPANRALLAGRVLAFVGIVLVAANLRTAVAALSPIVGRVSAEIPLSAVVIGLLGALPPICFAVFGIFTPMLVRRSRLEIVLIGCLVAIVLGHLLRGFAGSVGILVLGSVLTFAGIGVGNVLLPPLVKKYFPDRVGLLTALYVTTMSVSTFVPPLVAVPVADAAGWRLSLAMWAVVGVLALMPWAGILLRGSSQNPGAGVEDVRADVARSLWRSPLAWALAVVFGLSSLNAYAMFAWLPVLLEELTGVSDATAGSLLAVFAFMGFPAGLLIPLIAGRMRNVALLVYLAVALFIAGYLGLLLAPAALPGLWVGLVGLGPILFPLALVLINLRTRTHASAIALSGFVQSMGYFFGAAGPLAFGILYAITGGWTASLILMIVLALGGIGAGAVVARGRMLEDGA